MNINWNIDDIPTAGEFKMNLEFDTFRLRVLLNHLMREDPQIDTPDIRKLRDLVAVKERLASLLDPT